MKRQAGEVMSESKLTPAQRQLALKLAVGIRLFRDSAGQWWAFSEGLFRYMVSKPMCLRMVKSGYLQERGVPEKHQRQYFVLTEKARKELGL